MNVRPAGLEHSLAVIAGSERPDHRPWNTCGCSREQDGALDLCARRLAEVVDRLETAPTHGHRESTVLRQSNRRTHFTQRLRDATHRPARQARIADEPRVEWSGGGDSRHQA